MQLLWKRIMWISSGGNPDLIDFFVDRGEQDYISALIYVVVGHLPAINRIHEFEDINMNSGLYRCALVNHFDLVDFYLHFGANDLENAFKKTGLGGPTQMLAFLINRGAKNDNRAALGAVSNGKYRNVEYFT